MVGFIKGITCEARGFPYEDLVVRQGMFRKELIEAASPHKQLKIGLEKGAFGDPGGYGLFGAFAARPFEGAFHVATVTKAFVVVDLGGGQLQLRGEGVAGTIQAH